MEGGKRSCSGFDLVDMLILIVFIEEMWKLYLDAVRKLLETSLLSNSPLHTGIGRIKQGYLQDNRQETGA
jgi:hypothetical protein